MTWPFCPLCGTILDPPELDTVKCSLCAYECNFNNVGVEEVTTKSAPSVKPAWIGDNTDAESTKEKHATIEEPCPKCGHPEMYFYTMQLRSVDEGQTVFYECIACAHKYSVNN